MDSFPPIQGRMGIRKNHRDTAAASLIVELLPSLNLQKKILLIGEDDSIRQALPTNANVISWYRKATHYHIPCAWIPDEQFDLIIMRLPIGKDAYTMLLQAAVSHLSFEGKLLVYGANDEGIKSVSQLLNQFFKQVNTVLTKRHCRVIDCSGVLSNLKLKSLQSDWEEKVNVHTPVGEVSFISYPSLFAHGRLDPGTELLLTVLPTDLSSQPSVLDFASGSGVVALVLQKLYPKISLDLIDNDALAISAAKINLPKANVYCCDNLDVVAEKKYDLIVSNPPIHKGKEEDFSVLLSLIKVAPKLLRRDGQLLFVVQATVPVQKELAKFFNQVELKAKNNQYTVWLGKLR